MSISPGWAHQAPWGAAAADASQRRLSLKISHTMTMQEAQHRLPL